MKKVSWDNQFGKIDKYNDPNVLQKVKKQALAVMNYSLQGGKVPEGVLKTARLVWKTIADESRGNTPQIRIGINVIKTSLEKAGYTLDEPEKLESKKVISQ